jgi:hypothetical protein
MTRPRLTIRVRLTLLYTGLFAVCGAIVVAITYALVRASLPEINDTTPVVTETAASAARNGAPGTPAEFLNRCLQAFPQIDVAPGVQYKCEAAFRAAFIAGANSQRDLTLHTCCSTR